MDFESQQGVEKKEKKARISTEKTKKCFSHIYKNIHCGKIINRV
uniref:Uncharacterized protein n=1 Tax=Rhizophora mucronata TaxID=61149 RepID=A0A2P2R3Q9_RHIMU